MTEQAAIPVQISTRESILDVTLSDPPDNRMTFAMLRGLNTAIDRFESDSNLRLLLLQGCKTAFSKGFDLSLLGKDLPRRDLRKSLILSNALFSRLARCPKPTVAAISGACLGGGLELALACHFRLCSDRARLGLPEIWIRLVPGLGGAYRLCRLIGQARALELVALGDLLSPEDALSAHLVHRVFPRAEFSERVNGFVNALLMADSRALSHALAQVRASGVFGEEENIRLGLEAFADLAATWTPSTTN